MNTKKMIADIQSECKELEIRKADLLAHVKAIDDQITAYHMAVDALDLSMSSSVKPAEPVASNEKQKKFGHKTIIEFGGKKQTVVQWAKEMDITADGIIYRLNTGWSVTDALTKRKMQGKTLEERKPKKVFAYDRHNNVIRQYMNIGDASRDLNLARNVIEKMLTDISIADQLASRNFYLAYAS